MKLHFILAVASPIVLSPIPPALANGAWSEFPAGGVIFKSEQNISIAREDLEVGHDIIRVRYVFESSWPEPVSRTIGFPMAKVPLDDSPDNYPDRSWAQEGQDIRNYMGLEVSVDGRPLAPPVLHEYAWLGETDVTAKLREMNVPVFAASTEDYASLARLPEATVEKLLREELAVEEGEWLVPQWQYQTVYEWTQLFEPGRSEVEITYRPLYGSFYGPEPYHPEGSESANYCYGSDTRQKLAAILKAGALPTPFTVGYILRTAGYWNGPIAEFNLKVRRGERDIVSFCVPDGLKATGDGVSWSAEQFEPRSDLNFVFFRRDE